MAARHIALQYMNGFHCIGPACEDHCCRGWTVVIDQVHHDKLRALMTERGEAARFDAAMSPMPPPRVATKALFAVINTGADGNCVFLTPERSCEVHGQHGEEYLSDTCATYPRRVSRAGTRVEVNASVSCPEVARKLLLDEDACEIVACEPSLQGRGAVMQRLAADATDPYSTSFDQIRGTMYGLLTSRAYPMRSRLFFLVMFGERLSSYLVKDTPLADPARLADDIQTLEEPATLALIDEGLRGKSSDTVRAVGLVMQLLSTRLAQPSTPRFRQTCIDVLKSFAAAGAGVTINGDDIRSATVLPTELAAYLDAHKDAREVLVGPRLELYLENYCRNWVFHDWYVTAPSISLHVQRLLVRVAMLRMLLIHHPDLPAAAAAGPEAIDRLAVEVFYSMARTFEHSTEAVQLMIAAHVGEAPPLAVALELLRI